MRIKCRLDNASRSWLEFFQTWKSATINVYLKGDLICEIKRRLESLVIKYIKALRNNSMYRPQAKYSISGDL